MHIYPLRTKNSIILPIHLLDPVDFESGVIVAFLVFASSANKDSSHTLWRVEKTASMTLRRRGLGDYLKVLFWQLFLLLRVWVHPIVLLFLPVKKFVSHFNVFFG